MTRRRRGCDWEHDAYPRVPRAPTAAERSQKWTENIAAPAASLERNLP